MKIIKRQVTNEAFQLVVHAHPVNNNGVRPPMIPFPVFLFLKTAVAQTLCSANASCENVLWPQMAF